MRSHVIFAVAAVCGATIAFGQTLPPRDDSRCGPLHEDAGCNPGLCCSPFGFCGDTPEHCGDESVSGPPRPDGRCGPNFDNAGCERHYCCHPEHGWCGNTTAHCDVDRLDPTLPRIDGRCGPYFGGALCMPGFCCSPRGHCGNSDVHCSGDPYVEPEDYDLYRDRLNFTRCGAAYGNCTQEDECCDEYGFCGTGSQYNAGFCSGLTLDIIITAPSSMPNSSNMTNSTMDAIPMTPVDDEEDEEEGEQYSNPTTSPSSAAPADNNRGPGDRVNTQQQKSSSAVAIAVSHVFIITAMVLFA